MPYLIGVDIGGTKVSVSLGNTEGKILIRQVFSTEGAQVTLSKAKEIIQAYLKKFDPGLKRTRGIGISCAGALDLKKGILISAPNMPSWHNVPLKRIFSRSFNLEVVVDNDANAAALGEKIFGAGKRVKNLFYYTVSTGVGGGLIIDGQIHHGASFDAGEIGHTVILPRGPKCNCGKRGCLESLASGTAIARIARERVTKDALILKLAGKKKNIDAAVVGQAARQGDRLAREIYRRAAFYLGISVANVIQIVNPEMIIIGGGVSRAGSLLFKPLIQTVRTFSWTRAFQSCRIIRSKLKETAGDLGAMSLVIKKA